MKMALDALEELMPTGSATMHLREEAIAALSQALEQPSDGVEQEPVGEEWTPCVKLPVVVHVRNQRKGETHVSTREGITPVKPDDLIMRGVSGEEYPIGRKIFEQTYTLDITTAPPKREWQGLTDEEALALVAYTHPLMSKLSVARAIETKLKEKNT